MISRGAGPKLELDGVNVSILVRFEMVCIYVIQAFSIEVTESAFNESLAEAVL